MDHQTQLSPAHERMARLTGLLEFGLKLAAVLVPILYVMGRIYSEAYWDTLGLPATLMAYSVQDYLYFGFLSMFVGLAHTVGAHPYNAMGYALLVAGGITVFVVMIRLADWVAGPTLRAYIAALEQRIRTARASKHGAVVQHAQVAAAVWSGASSLLMVMLTAVLLSFLPIVFAVSAGRAQAVEERAQWLDPAHRPKTKQPPATVTYRSEATLRTASLVECSEAWCMVYDQGAFVALPRTDVVRIGQPLTTLR